MSYSNLEGCLIQIPTHCCNSPFYSETLFLLQQLSEQHSSLSIKRALMTGAGMAGRGTMYEGHMVMEKYNKMHLKITKM